jgi:hypothetical protein
MLQHPHPDCSTISNKVLQMPKLTIVNVYWGAAPLQQCCNSAALQR